MKFYLITYYTKDGRSIGRAFARTSSHFLNIAEYEETNNVIVMSFQEISEVEYLHAVVPVKTQLTCLKLAKKLEESKQQVAEAYRKFLWIAEELITKKERVTQKKLKEIYKQREEQSQGGNKYGNN